MPFNLDTFKSNFQGGARSYLFMFSPQFPAGVSSIPAAPETKYLVRATSVPESTTEEIIVNWQGADRKLAGKQTFADWTITFNVDMQSTVRVAYEEWIKSIHNVDGDHKYGYPVDYEMTQNLWMLNYDGSEHILDIELVDAFPKSVSAITLDYSAMDIAQFDVTFGYLYHRITKAS
jgi:hypothetical protein